jgi:acyl-CoA reductase-like NAD-dependent aldehyde dehydrogenase
MTTGPLDDLRRAIEAAREAAARAARRPRREIATALATAASRWATDATLRAALPVQAQLSPAVVAAGLDIGAEAVEPDAMMALADRELGRERPARSWLVAHVLASNVPALAVPAIVLSCLAGAAVLVKSGRADQLSAPAFRRALDAEDPELAATVVTTYWPGGDTSAAGLLAPADLIVASGHDASVAAIAGRFHDRVIAHGERASIVIADRAALDAPGVAEGIARDVALHDQRGCLSPVAVYVAGDAADFAHRLVAALDACAGVLPPGPLDPLARAAHRTALAQAEWDGATVLRGAAGTVLLGPAPRLRASPGRRTVWVHPLTTLTEALPAGGVECVGGAGVALDLDLLRRLGVSRVCPPGRMQQPPLAWPRGQRAPLRTLIGLPAEPQLMVEPS